MMFSLFYHLQPCVLLILVQMDTTKSKTPGKARFELLWGSCLRQKGAKSHSLNCHMQLCATETQHLCKFHTQTNKELSFSLIGFHVQCLLALCKPSKSAFRLARVQLGARCSYYMEFCKVRLPWCRGWGGVQKPSVRGWMRGKARIVHNKPISFFSPAPPPPPPSLFFHHTESSIGCLHHSHNANHSRSLFMRWLICKDCPSSSNSRQRGNGTASRVVLNLSLRTDLYFSDSLRNGAARRHEFMDN